MFRRKTFIILIEVENGAHYYEQSMNDGCKCFVNIWEHSNNNGFMIDWTCSFFVVISYEKSLHAKVKIRFDFLSQEIPVPTTIVLETKREIWMTRIPVPLPNVETEIVGLQTTHQHSRC